MTPEEYFRKNPPRVSNPRSGVDPRLSVYKEDGRLFTNPMEAISKQQSMYGFGGGTIGGDIWNYRQPTTIERMMGKNEPIPELKPELRGKVNVMPAGRGAAQELRSMREAGGRPYVEAPERFERGKGTSQRDREEQFYSTVTGRPVGTLMGTGGYGGFGGGGPQSSQRSWDNYVEPVGPRNPDYIARSGFKSMNSVGGPQPAESAPMSSGGSPLEFTGFGGMMREQEEEMNRGLGSLTGFGGIPRFPFANY